MPEALSQHQVFVLSTHYEGIGLAVIEAMACGCACIATDVVGVQELIEHGVTGLLVPENDPHALADAITQLLADPQRAEAMGQRARERALAAHSHHLMQERYHQLVQRCLVLEPGR
jgi:glycosyltransferase involved in cell wall biosynthesis